MNEKQQMRARMLAMRCELRPEELAGASEGILRQLLAMPIFRKAIRVAAYLSLPTELPMGGLIRFCYGQGQSVSVPAWRQAEHDYAFAALDPAAHLTLGPMRVMEPEAKRWTPTESVDVFLVPGLAFDARGGRLGRGKGFYDRLLGSARPDSIRIGICCEWQVVPAVPTDAHDVRMDVIVTESRCIACRPELQAQLVCPLPSSAMP